MKCWYCGHDTMCPKEDLGKGWMKCVDCGATHFPNPTKVGAKRLKVRLNKELRQSEYEPIPVIKKGRSKK